MPPSVGILEAQSAPVKGLHFEARSGDSSAFAGASVLASLSNPRKELSLLPPPSQNEVDNDIMDADVDTSDHNDRDVVPLCEKALSSDAANENMKGDTLGLDASIDTDIENVPGPSHEFDLSGGIPKLLSEQREITEVVKDFDPPILIATRRQEFKDGLQQGILNFNNIEVSFENFPYYLRCIP